MDRIITNSMIGDFESYLRSDEKSNNSIEKYLRDVRLLAMFAETREISKAVVMEFKALLAQNYEVTSANSMIAAVNAFLRFMGWVDCYIKQFKVQKKAFCSEEKELTKAEYVRLVNAAKAEGNDRLNLILQTICGTGIRVSELQFITVEAVRKGYFIFERIFVRWIKIECKYNNDKNYMLCFLAFIVCNGFAM